MDNGARRARTRNLPKDWCLETASGECLKLIENSAVGQLDHSLGGTRTTIDLESELVSAHNQDQFPGRDLYIADDRTSRRPSAATRPDR